MDIIIDKNLKKSIEEVISSKEDLYKIKILKTGEMIKDNVHNITLGNNSIIEAGI